MYYNPKTIVHLLIVVILVIFSVLCDSCANRISPTGGPKDTIPPFITSSIPRNQSINFKGNTIILEFNEWIKESNLRTQLLITPPLKGNYVPKIVRNRVEIKLEEPLEDSTTYNFNFREGVVDITESNIAIVDTLSSQDLKIAFSTGYILDSMSVNGQIISLPTRVPLKETVVSLYQVNDTLNIREDKPYYFTLTNEEGFFNIQNIKAGSYRLYAFQDNNNDLIYQEPEAIAFLKDSIQFTDKNTRLDSLILKATKEDHTSPEIRKSRAVSKYYEITFNEGIQTIDIQFLEEWKDTFKYHMIEGGKKLKLYNPEEIYDSIPLTITIEDSLSNKVILEEKIAFKESTNTRASPNKPLNVELKLLEDDKLANELQLDLLFDKPVKEYDFQKIKYQIDQDTLHVKPLLYRDSTAHYTWNKMHTELSIRRKILLKESIEITIDTASFISIEQDSSDFIQKKFLVKKPSKYGSIYGNIITEFPHYIIQLLDDNFKVVREAKDAAKINFQYLKEATYKLRVIIDENKNGKWDQSNLDQGLSAEKIIFLELPGEGKLKEKWDTNVTLKF